MKTGPTYAVCFILFVFVSCNFSLSAQALVSYNNKSEAFEKRTEPKENRFESAPSPMIESIHREIQKELQESLSYPEVARENCFEKRVVVHLTFLDATSRPEVVIYRDDQKVFSNEIQRAIQQMDFTKFLPHHIDKEMPVNFYLPIEFSLR